MRPRLSMRCWVERDQGAADPYNSGESWAEHLADEPCYWWVTAGSEAVDGQRAVTLADEHLMLDRGADLRAGDRIVRVDDHKGRTVFDASTAAGLVRDVEHVAAQRDHLDATLRSTG